MEAFIAKQQSVLDEIIFEAAKTYYDVNKQKDNFYFDIIESCNEQWLLSAPDKKDLCYDRPSIGFTYSLWYHGKRINTFLKYFITELSKESGNTIEIFDLGAGAGAVQWAVGLAYLAMLDKGIKPPTVHLTNIDTSPFMLLYSQHFLWPQFLKRFPQCASIKITYQINSWNNPANATKSNVWVVASYLFDNSESRTQVGEDFKELINEFQPTKVLLTTSYNKREYLQTVAKTLSDKYISTPAVANTQVFSGTLLKVNKFRSELDGEIKSKGQTSPFKNAAKWDIDSLAGIVLAKRQNELGLMFDSLSLYNGPFKREQVHLNKKQLEAAKHKNKPTKIIGPAGCGKSVVITERIKHLVEQGNYDASLRILLTTFNKDLIRCLGDWLEAILDRTKVERRKKGDAESCFYLKGSTQQLITVYHFDILPTRIGKLTGDVRKGIFFNTGEEVHFHLMKKAIELNSNDKNFNEVTDFCSPDFLLDEFHRVIYGYNIATLQQYQITKRRGRGTPVFRHNSVRKEIVYKIINTYLELLAERNYESFTTMRKRFLRHLELGLVNESEKFTHIFVDELQDCTYADYQIFYKLLKNNHHKNIVFAGDLAQSIQLGAALFIPKAEDAEMGRWENHLLEGSYRLPFRISEAIYELSRQINTRYGKREDVEVSVITPYRGAPPGSRLIFVYADSLNEMVQKTKAIYDDYCCFFGNDKTVPVTIYERDDELVAAFKAASVAVENEHILRSKGMEKKFVYWSSRTPIDSENEVYEFVYTILTRTCCLLVIGLSKTTNPAYHKIINTFRRDRIILWDAATKENFESFCEEVHVVPIEEETDIPAA